MRSQCDKEKLRPRLAGQQLLVLFALVSSLLPGFTESFCSNHSIENNPRLAALHSRLSSWWLTAVLFHSFHIMLPHRESGYIILLSLTRVVWP